MIDLLKEKDETIKLTFTTAKLKDLLHLLERATETCGLNNAQILATDIDEMKDFLIKEIRRQVEENV
jgi:hypothetical protein